MIGIDITRISRFTKDISRYNKVFGTSFDNKKDLAKFWACYEALIKASNIYFKPNEISIVFLPRTAPSLLDKQKVLNGEYCLSISHDGDIVAAVAVLKEKYDD